MDESAFVEKLNGMRAFFNAGHTRPIRWRKQQLRALKAMLAEHHDDFAAALVKDLRKNAFETVTSETGFVVAEIDHAMAHIDDWVRPLKVETPLFAHPAQSRLLHEPLGVALIMGAWNYPVNLTLAPLVPAIAAGNAAVVKPPRTAAAAAQVMADLLPRYLDPNAFSVVASGISNDFLLKQPWDKIFLTGSGRVGKIVMRAAARQLIPVTLELGGKSPAIVDAEADVAVSAKRIVNGKFFNAGQTCVAPDYVLVHTAVADALIGELERAVERFFGPDPQQSPDYGRIINAEQFDRLVAYLADGRVVLGGRHDRQDLYIAPTLLQNVSSDAAVMREEIFGPVLPVLTVDSIEDGIAFVNRRDKPLALYVFTENRKTVQKVISQTSSGGVCVNDSMYQLAVPDLPFGGVGPSGMGRYHGEAGFKAFSNAKAVLERETGFDPDLRYPPYDRGKLKKVKTLMHARLRLPGFAGRAVTAVFKQVLRTFGNRLLNRGRQGWRPDPAGCRRRPPTAPPVSRNPGSK